MTTTASLGSNNGWLLPSITVIGVAMMLAAIAPPVMKTTTKDNTMMSTADQNLMMPLLVVGSLVAGGIAFQIFQQSINRNGNSGGSATADTDCTTTTKNTNISMSTSSFSTPTTIKNIWQAGRSQGILKKEKSYNNKPFGSKYYYAHNNPTAIGGYKDGLKMEDYRMNGPRLLSKNGISVLQEEHDNNENASGDASECHDDPSNGGEERSSTVESSQERMVPLESNVRHITKYLWDDPGDSNGVATIRIDILPDKRPGEFLDWKDVKAQNVSASLAGEGLIVKIATTVNGDDTVFRLKIAKLYGDAADVKCIIKPKRLLVKLYKKKISFLSLSKSNNLDAWPQPHRKI
jgi:hypothetical protein